MSLKNLYPGRMVSSVYEMDWEKLALTYRGVIFDIDNTLVPHGRLRMTGQKSCFQGFTDWE